LDFEPYLIRWRLVADGKPIATRTSWLLPVRQSGVAAILKVALEPEERRGAGLMTWWGGEGAARVLAHEGDALLLERATGETSLTDMVLAGSDDEATEILCRAAAQLHQPRDRPVPALVPLVRWFEQLKPAAAKHGGILSRAADVARELLANQRDLSILHGDLHHGNVLDFGPKGWLAIDPKGIHGERTFDFVNILRTPTPEVALAPGRFARQVRVISRVAHLDRLRLLEWTLAFTGLSAAWLLTDGERPELDLAVAELALGELERR
jgi:streptomycin 6-kinase